MNLLYLHSKLLEKQRECQVALVAQEKEARVAGQRLEAGTYGVWIEPARLEAVCWAAHCLDMSCDGGRVILHNGNVYDSPLLMYFWTKADQANVLVVSDRVATGIKLALDEANIYIRYPHAVLMFEGYTGVGKQGKAAPAILAEIQSARETRLKSDGNGRERR